MADSSALAARHMLYLDLRYVKSAFSIVEYGYHDMIIWMEVGLPWLLYMSCTALHQELMSI